MVTLQSWLENTQALPVASATTGDEQFRIIQGGVSKTLTAALLASYLAGVGSELAIGTTPISGGTSGNVLYNAAGFVGELGTTGSGNVVRATSPTLVTPALGTPSALVLTNATGLPATALVADTTTAVGFGSIELGHASDTTLTRVSAGVVAVEGVTVLTTATGQPLDADLTSWAAVTRASGFDAFVATPSSANLAALLTDETGSGASVFANTPTLVTPVIGAATGTSLTVTGTLYAYSGTAIPAGGTTGAGVKFSSTSNYGVFFGSGAPTLSAAQGSIYLRSDGTAAAGVYINTDGSSTWGAVGTPTTPGGSTTQVQYNDAGAFAGDSGFTYSSTNKAITLGGATVTASAPVLDLSQTWNSGGTTFTGLKLNVTDTASASASLLMDLRVGGSTKANITMAGKINLDPTTTLGTNVQFLQQGNVAFENYYGFSGPTLRFNVNGTIGFFVGYPNNSSAATGAPFGAFVSNDAALGWAPTNSTGDVFLYRDAANTLALRNSTSAQTLRAYNTYTDPSNGEWGTFDWSSSANVLTIGTNKNGSGSTRAVQFVVGGTQIANFATTGHLLWNTNNTYDIGAAGGTKPRNIYAGTAIEVADSGYFGFNGRAALYSDAANNIRLYGWGASISLLQFGGTTSSFPAIKRSSTDLQIRLADDSDYAGLQLGTASSALKVGTHSAIAAETVTGYITIKDSAGTDRKIAVVS